MTDKGFIYIICRQVCKWNGVENGKEKERSVQFCFLHFNLIAIANGSGNGGGNSAWWPKVLFLCNNLLTRKKMYLIAVLLRG